MKKTQNELKDILVMHIKSILEGKEKTFTFDSWRTQKSGLTNNPFSPLTLAHMQIYTRSSGIPTCHYFFLNLPTLDRSSAMAEVH